MDLNETKGLCIALMLIDTLLFGWPPYFLVRGGNQSRRSLYIRNLIISILKCFAGGVFLGACLLHLLAEGRELMDEYFEKAGTKPSFPVYEAVVAGGFFAIALVEKVTHKLLKTSPSHPGREKHEHSLPGAEQATAAMSVNGDTNGYVLQSHVDTITEAPNGWDNPVFVAVKSDNYEVGMDSEEPSKQDTTKEIKHVPHEEHDNKSLHEHGDQAVQIAQAMEANPLRAFLLLGAMSFHTIFDGLAVGLQTSETQLWQMFTAIAIHKTLVAVCLGLQLFLAFKSKPFKGFIWVFVFSLIAPIGVGIGMILTSGNIDETAEDLVNWILQGIATGTFLYVTVFEILMDEFEKSGRITNVFIAMLGFGGMAVAKYFDKDKIDMACSNENGTCGFI